MSNIAGTHSAAKLQRNLGLWHVIIIGLAYIQPMTVFDTFGLVSVDSLQHVPSSYIVALVAILLTSISYGHMIRRYPSSGSAYTYAQKSIHPNVGFMVGWSSWLDYLLSPLVNIILAVIYLKALFPDVNHWVWVVALTSFMTIINIFGAKVVAYFNSWIVFVQIFIIGIFTYMLYHSLSIGINADGQLADQETLYQLWSLTPFWSELTSIGALITGATLLCFSFTGFDSLSTLVEETKDAKKTLPKAIFLTALLAGLIFISSTYIMQLFFPADPSTYFTNIEETQPEILAFANPIFAELMSNLNLTFLLVAGATFKSLVLTFAIVAVMASGISAHAGVSRLMYVMGRDGVINKKIFGHISPRFHTPTYNILIAGAIALTAGFIGFETIAELISFGALTAFSFVNLSVIVRYVLRDRQVRSMKEIISYLIIPFFGFVAVFLMWLDVSDVALKWGLSWAVIGVFYLAYKTGGFTRPAPQHNEFDD